MGADCGSSISGKRTTGRLILRTLAGWTVACVALAVLCSSAFAATGTVTGTVTDASTHAPAADVDVVVYDSDGDFDSSACTQADGTYEATDLDPGTYSVGFATSPGFCAASNNFLPQYYNDKSSFETADPVSVTSGGTTSHVDAALQSGGEITGTVTDGSTHAAAANQEVDLYDARGDEITSACTDTDGTYTFGGLTAGSYDVGFAPTSGFCGGDANYLPQFYNGKSSLTTADPVSVSAGATVSNINAALQRGGEIAGTVTDASTHAAVAGVSVEVFDSSGDAVGFVCSASDGTYSLEGLQTDSYEVQFAGASSGCGPDLNYLPQFYDGKTSLAAADPVPVTAGSTTPNINAALQSAGQVTGTVTDASTHGALSGVFVEVLDSSGDSVAFASSDSSGNYTVTGIPTGTYTVEFSSSANYLIQYYNGKSTLDAADPVHVTAGSTTPNINAALQPGGQITGTVTDASTHADVAGVEIDVIDSSGNFVGDGFTDASGHYTAQRLPTGSYTVEFSGDDNYLTQYYNGKSSFAAADPVAVTAGSTTPNINAALQPAGKITGTVTDASTHAGAGDIDVEVMDSNGDEVSGACTAADGTYTASGLPTGSYHVAFAQFSFACGGDGNYQTQFYNGKSSLATADPVPVTAGSTTSNINAALQPGGQITGTVTDASTHADVADIDVEVIDSNGGEVSTTCTAADGTYTASGLATGSYHVAFAEAPFDCGGDANYQTQYYNGKSSLAAADPVAVTGGSTTANINAALEQAGKITGTVTDASTHAGVHNLEVDVYDSGGDVVNTTCTAADGSYTVNALTQGSYRVGFTGQAGNCGLLPLNYLPQFYNGKSTLAAATSVSVTSGATTPNINAAMQTGGRISGTVTDASTHGAVSNIEVDVYDSSSTQISSDTTFTDSSGNYVIAGLAPGTYKIGFTDPDDVHAAQFYNDKSSLAGADPVTVTSGTTTSAINAALTAAPTTTHLLSVAPAGSGAGTVTSAPAGISCAPTCSSSFTAGTQVTLTAVPASGSTFAGWSGGGCSGTGACVVTMTADQAVTATFNGPASVGPAGGGGGTGGGGSTGGGGGSAGGTGGTGGTHAAAPSCHISLPSHKVLLKKSNKHKGVKPGTLTAKVTCTQAAKLALGGKLKITGKKPRHGKAKTKTVNLATVHGNAKAGKATLLTVKLPGSALSALSHGGKESIAFTLTASNANGTGHSTAKIGSLGKL